MITLVILYLVLGLSGGYVVKKTTDVYMHVDTNNAKRYDACVKAADNVNECKNLE